MKITITGGKGGTGKSTIATAIAFELSKKNKALLIDADADNPNDHLILSIKRKKVKTVEKMIPKWDLGKCKKCGKCSEICKTNAIVCIKDRDPIFIPEQCNGCGACIIGCPEKAIKKSKKEIGMIFSGKKENLSFLSGEIQPSEPISEFVVNAVKKYSEETEKSYDFIIVDTAAGTHCPVISAIYSCDLAIVVTEPTPLGAHDLELILQLLKIMKIPSKIVLNKCDIGDKSLIKNIAQKFNIKIIAEIPYDKHILELYSKGEPIIDKNIKNILGELDL